METPQVQARRSAVGRILSALANPFVGNPPTLLRVVLWASLTGLWIGNAVQREHLDWLHFIGQVLRVPAPEASPWWVVERVPYLYALACVSSVITAINLARYIRAEATMEWYSAAECPNGLGHRTRILGGGGLWCLTCNTRTRETKA